MSDLGELFSTLFGPAGTTGASGSALRIAQASLASVSAAMVQSANSVDREIGSALEQAQLRLIDTDESSRSAAASLAVPPTKLAILRDRGDRLQVELAAWLCHRSLRPSPLL